MSLCAELYLTCPTACIFILKFEIQMIRFPVSQNWGPPHACFAKMTVTKHISWVQDSHVKVTRQPTTSKRSEHNYHRTSEWQTLTPRLVCQQWPISLAESGVLWHLCFKTNSLPWGCPSQAMCKSSLTLLWPLIRLLMWWPRRQHRFHCCFTSGLSFCSCYEC